MERFVLYILLKYSTIQTLFVCMAECIIAFAVAISSKQTNLFYKNPFLIGRRSVWFLCKTNLSKSSLLPSRVPVAERRWPKMQDASLRRWETIYTLVCMLARNIAQKYLSRLDVEKQTYRISILFCKGVKCRLRESLKTFYLKKN